MTDDEFVAAVANQSLPGGFGHAEHVRLAWILLRRYGLGGAGDVMSRLLRRLAVSNGRAEAYHDTITWAFLLLVNTRLPEHPTSGAWQEFADANPDLLTWPNPTLHGWWSPELLATDAARRRVALPDRVGHQAVPH